MSYYSLATKLGFDSFPKETADKLRSIANVMNSMTGSGVSRLSHDDVHTVLKHGDFYDKSLVLRANSNIAPDHIDKALDDPNPATRVEAIDHRSASEDNVTKAMKDRNSVVRLHALRAHAATIKHVVMGLEDNDRNVRSVAARHILIHPKHHDYALNHQDGHKTFHDALIHSVKLHNNID